MITILLIFGKLKNHTNVMSCNSTFFFLHIISPTLSLWDILMAPYKWNSTPYDCSSCQIEYSCKILREMELIWPSKSLSEERWCFLPYNPQFIATLPPFSLSPFFLFCLKTFGHFLWPTTLPNYIYQDTK